MNIWEAYCNKDYYNVYFDILVAKGMKRSDVESVKLHYLNYIQRIKESPVKNMLEECQTTIQFNQSLHKIFDDLWKGYIKYEEVCTHFYQYLFFLDSIQALHRDFISNQDRARLVDVETDIPIQQLTRYEREYMVNGKLVALMNPLLLYYLKDYIEEEGQQPKKSVGMCKNFYGDLLPEMTTIDYLKLLTYLWPTARKVKTGGKKNKFKITFPDGTSKIYPIFEGLKEIVVYYGIDNVFLKGLEIRKEKLIVKYCPWGKEQYYEKVLPGFYVYNGGNTKDRHNACNAINVMFGKKLLIELWR